LSQTFSNILISCRELFVTSEKLQYMETRTVIVQAFITDLVLSSLKKRKRVVEQEQRKKRRSDVVPESDTENEQEEEIVHQIEEGNDISLTVTIEDLNKSSSLETYLNIWRLQNYHPAQADQQGTVAEQVSDLMFQFFNQSNSELSHEVTLANTLTDLKRSVVDRLYILCVQMTRLSDTNVRYSLVQAYPVTKR
jgi:heme exporter protein D